MKRVLEYILAFLIILECNSVYSRLLNDNNLINIALIGALILLIIVNVIKKKNLNRVITIGTYLLLYFIYIALYMLITSAFNIKFIYLFVLCLPLFIMLYSLDKDNPKNILTAMLNVILGLCVLSLIIWLIGPIFKIIMTFFTF